MRALGARCDTKVEELRAQLVNAELAFHTCQARVATLRATMGTPPMCAPKALVPATSPCVVGACQRSCSKTPLVTSASSGRGRALPAAPSACQSRRQSLIAHRAKWSDQCWIASVRRARICGARRTVVLLARHVHMFEHGAREFPRIRADVCRMRSVFDGPPRRGRCDRPPTDDTLAE